MNVQPTQTRKRMTLIDDWKHLAPRLWSIRLSLLSAILSAAEFAIPYFAPAVPSGRFAAAAMAVGLAAAVSRVIAQPKVTG